MQKHRKITLERLEKFISDVYWTDVNLYSQMYTQYHPIQISHKTGKGSHLEPILEVISSQEGWEPVKIGSSYGPSWSTHYFRLEITIPDDWKHKEVHLLWNSNCEAMLFTPTGKCLIGFTNRGDIKPRKEYVLSKQCKGGERLSFLVEMACTGMFGNGKGGLLHPPDPNLTFTLDEAQIGVFNREKWLLYWDFTVIYDCARFLPENSPRGNQALYVANQIVNTYRFEDPSTIQAGRQIAANFLAQKNGDSQFQLFAIGHCHIDTAWLWPYSETKRKCARSWCTAIQYMDEYPHYIFTASQAQQYEWVKILYPELYSRIKNKVKSGQFIPTGGTWVEMDCNIPSGESLVRQFLFGQQFFFTEFGKYCTEFWLPDTFGYSAQLPQLVKSAEMNYFLTQKLSWNLFNKPPNSTFLWEGIDGTKILTHFPPADNYNCRGSVEEVLKSATNNRDNDRTVTSLLVYGEGDGGGGPHLYMLEQLKRMENLAEIPKVKMGTPKEFFDYCASTSNDLCVWKGELFFELHQGTYTTQARNKLGNRQSEILLREIELFFSLASVINKETTIPKEEIKTLWKLVLLNQFHDVIPGSSIEQVTIDSLQIYSQIREQGNQLLKDGIDFFSTQYQFKRFRSDGFNTIVFNSLNWSREEVIEVGSVKKPIQLSVDGKPLIFIQVPEMAEFEFLSDLLIQEKRTLISEEREASILQISEGIILENYYLKAEFNWKGLLKSLIHKPSSRECIAPNQLGNKFVIYEDIPFFWDAWDTLIYHLEKRQDNFEAYLKIIETGPLRVGIEISTTLTSVSWIKQRVFLAYESKRLDFQTEVEWREKYKFLKVEFPFNVHSSNATYEIQFGHVQRPTHYNTTWDLARFEVCGQKWADLSEYGFGVALLNNCKYGYATKDNVMRLSLLRSPKQPDPTADMGRHTIGYSVFPHTGTFQDGGVIHQAYNFNYPLHLLHRPLNQRAQTSYFTISHPSMIVEAIKPAEVEERTIIIRLYESFGGQCNFQVAFQFKVEAVFQCNILERQDVLLLLEGSTVKLSAKPFQILTLKVKSAIIQ